MEVAEAEKRRRRKLGIEEEGEECRKKGDREDQTTMNLFKDLIMIEIGKYLATEQKIFFGKEIITTVEQQKNFCSLKLLFPAKYKSNCACLADDEMLTNDDMFVAIKMESILSYRQTIKETVLVDEKIKKK